MMNSQGHLLSEQTFQYDFLKTIVNFSIYDCFLSKEAYTSVFTAWKDSIAWKTLIDRTSF